MGGDLETTLKNRPNLLIKGNNLIALHSLKEHFKSQSEQNKVKLIYIDPPYNTGSDSFNYNDRFNHSTYLTFMKNRLEIARELLRDDGVIFVQCDDNEQAYLKVLMDEIFGRQNFVNVITVRTKIGGVSGSMERKSIKDATEFINIFCKNKINFEFNEVKIKTPLNKFIQDYKNTDKSWKYTSVITELGDKVEVKRTDDFTFYKYEKFKTKSVKEFAKDLNVSEEYVYENYANKIFRTTNAQSSIRKRILSEMADIDNIIVSIEYTPIKGKNKNEKIEILYKDKIRNMIMFLSDNVSKIDGKFYYLETINTLWSDIQYNNLASEGNVDFANGKKPETLVQRILELTTQENDLVMDFFAGSGTTLAVAHKMKRRYIGIEQMEYIESITKERLKKVIEGEQGGISKAVSWSGGGNLIYCELASLNAKFIEKIENSSDENELNQIYESLQKVAFIDYRVDINDLKDMEFLNLDFTSKKRILKKCLDRNMDYIPYADIDDSEYKIDERAKKLNKIFYGENDG